MMVLGYSSPERKESSDFSVVLQGVPLKKFKALEFILQPYTNN